MSLRRKSPCKVNFILNILGRRADGFHELETLMHPLGIHDVLEFTLSGDGIQLTCTDPSLPVDGSNLVHRAASAFLAASGSKKGVRIHLEKRIPLAAGLGGGSANAAHTLTGLNELYGHPLPGARLFELAAALGSDVPFFLQDSPALAEGRGERVTSLEPFATLRDAFILLIHPGFGVSTAWAYQNLERFPQALNGTSGRAAKLAQALCEGGLAGARSHFYNSLEAPVLEKYPLLALYQEFLRDHGAPVVLMSGSGSTTFALVEGQAEAGRLEQAFRQRFGPGAWTAISKLG
jgi:4-diphosphocytidyl-2-C-methyl-D-erythritol kinase